MSTDESCPQSVCVCVCVCVCVFEGPHAFIHLDTCQLVYSNKNT